MIATEQELSDRTQLTVIGAALIRSPKDFWCGALLVVIGVLYFWISLSYPPGTASRMGPGFFPRILGVLLVVLGGVLIARSVVFRGPPLERFSLRPFLTLALAAAAFGLLIRPAGLVIAVLALVVIGSLADREHRWREALLLGLFLAVFSAVVFPIALGLPIPIWPNLI